MSHYFLISCFDGCQFAFYLYLQNNGMHKVKKTNTQLSSVITNINTVVFKFNVIIVKLKSMCIKISFNLFVIIIDIFHL